MKISKLLALAVLVIPLVGCTTESTPIAPENPTESPVERMEANGGELDADDTVSPPEVTPET